MLNLGRGSVVVRAVSGENAVKLVDGVPWQDGSEECGLDLRASRLLERVILTILAGGAVSALRGQKEAFGAQETRRID